MQNTLYNYHYSDKFNLYVVELNHTDMATKEDKGYGIDTWAKLFKATTWEEIKMITKDNPSMNSAAEAIYLSTANKDILEQCRIREDNIAHELYQNKMIKTVALIFFCCHICMVQFYHVQVKFVRIVIIV